MWWLAALGTLVVIGAIIGRSFARDVDRMIPAEEVQAIHERWLGEVQAILPVHRQVETTPANRGLAAVSS
jgi:cytochrome o ubiquinol oxidase subunit 1